MDETAFETELMESIESMVRHQIEMLPVESEVTRTGQTITIQIVR